MLDMNYTERDRKLFRERIVAWQDPMWISYVESDIRD